MSLVLQALGGTLTMSTIDETYGDPFKLRKRFALLLLCKVVCLPFVPSFQDFAILGNFSNFEKFIERD